MMPEPLASQKKRLHSHTPLDGRFWGWSVFAGPGPAGPGNREGPGLQWAALHGARRPTGNELLGRAGHH